METLWRDVRQTLRWMARQKGFTAAACLTLALGIGANTAIFSIVWGVLLKPLPYADPGRLVSVSEEHPGANAPLSRAYLSNVTLESWTRSMRTLEGVAAYSDDTYTVGQEDPVRLPGDVEAEEALEAGENPMIVAAAHPSASIAWAVLAEEALAEDKAVTAYAYARTGYHRGLDQLRRNGWKGFGPVPYAHEPNRGFLRCVAALAKAADTIGETDELNRCLDLLDDCDPAARKELGL